MATTRITEKISLLVESQFPQFIQNDYTTFIEFVEAYYRFLEQDQGALEIVQNAKSYSDIDSTTEAFVNYFLTKTYDSFPLLNQWLLYKGRFLLVNGARTYSSVPVQFTCVTTI